MVFFTVAVKVLIFALCFGAVIAVLVYVPQWIYTIPYAWHMGSTVTDEPEPHTFAEWRAAAHKYYKSKRDTKQKPKE